MSDRRIGGVGSVGPSSRPDLRDSQEARMRKEAHRDSINEDKALIDQVRQKNNMVSDQQEQEFQQQVMNTYADFKVALSPDLESLYLEKSTGGRETNPDEAKYLSSEEAYHMLEFIDPKGTKKRLFEDAAKKLSEARPGTEELMLDGFSKTLCSNKAEIYLMLWAMWDYIRQKKQKEELQERLKSIIDEYERQESAYLFNFFSLKNMAGTHMGAQNNVGFLDKMSDVLAGHVQLQSLRMTYQFISKLLSNEEYPKMVSLYMKVRSKQLRVFRNGEMLPPEEKTKLVTLLAEEKNLITLHSIYCLSDVTFKNMKKALKK